MTAVHRVPLCMDGMRGGQPMVMSGQVHPGKVKDQLPHPFVRVPKVHRTQTGVRRCHTDLRNKLDGLMDGPFA
jgi:hypothetical protein